MTTNPFIRINDSSNYTSTIATTSTNTTTSTTTSMLSSLSSPTTTSPTPVPYEYVFYSDVTRLRLYIMMPMASSVPSLIGNLLILYIIIRARFFQPTQPPQRRTSHTGKGGDGGGVSDYDANEEEKEVDKDVGNLSATTTTTKQSWVWRMMVGNFCCHSCVSSSSSSSSSSSTPAGENSSSSFSLSNRKNYTITIPNLPQEVEVDDISFHSSIKRNHHMNSTLSHQTMNPQEDHTDRDNQNDDHDNDNPYAKICSSKDGTKDSMDKKEPHDVEAFSSSSPIPVSSMTAPSRQQQQQKQPRRHSSTSVAVRTSYNSQNNAKRNQLTTYHRLLLGMSICDIINDISIVLGPIPLPKEKFNATIWKWAYGNTQTCTAQGFFIQFGFSVLYYNTCLILYFLCTIRYGMKHAYMEKYIEPYLHGVSLILPFLQGIIGMIFQVYNPLSRHCFVAQYGSRGQHVTLLYWLLVLAPFMIVVLFFPICIFLIYWTVRHQQVKTRRILLSNHSHSKERYRQVSVQCILFATVFFNTTFWYITSGLMDEISTLRNNGIEADNLVRPIFIFTLIDSIFYPMQGFFNFILFIRPRFLRLRRQNPEMSWVWVLRSTIHGRPVVGQDGALHSTQNSSVLSNINHYSISKRRPSSSIISTLSLQQQPPPPRESMNGNHSSVTGDIDASAAEDVVASTCAVRRVSWAPNESESNVDVDVSSPPVYEATPLSSGNLEASSR